jgi:Small acidic protein family
VLDSFFNEPQKCTLPFQLLELNIFLFGYTRLGAGPSQSVEDRQPESSVDVLKKQQELFASLDQQYQVARATTHTQRGLGLGFGSSNSSYPR